jgi:hypothetical protein
VAVLFRIGTALITFDFALLALVFASSVLFSWTNPGVAVTATGGTTSTAGTTSNQPAAGALPTPTVDIWAAPDGW